ncbi:LysE family translocator [Halobacteriales archaeon QS_5_70_15]|nr:MAG: LysE family translocator [Halobacteriales archaeon QS_5_70_15]
MLDVATLVAFVPAAVALILAPGSDTVYVLTSGLRDGRGPGVAGAAGVAAGVLVHTTGVALGLAALLRAVPEAYAVVRYAGATYLLYLGVRTLRSEESFALADGAGVGRSVGEGFAGGVIVNVLNPKVALFFLAFLPQFLPRNPPLADFAALGAIYAGLSLAYLALVAVFAESVRERLLSNPLARAGTRYLTGSVLAGVGLALAVEGLA